MRYEILFEGTRNLYNDAPTANYTVKGANPLLFLAGSVYWTFIDPAHNPDPALNYGIRVLLDGAKIMVDGSEKGVARIGGIDKGTYASVVPLFIPLRGVRPGPHTFKLEYAGRYVPEHESGIGQESNFCLAIFDFGFE